MIQEVRKSTNTLVTLAFVVFGGPGIIGVYLPAWITHWRMPQAGLFPRLAAIVLIMTGLLPLGESIVRFIRQGGTLSPTHPTETLVIRGFYRYVRNPMYLGVLTLIAGQALLFESRTLWQYLAWVAIGFHAFVMLYEEPTLRRKYGTGYETFCRNVPRWLPRLRPWTNAPQ